MKKNENSPNQDEGMDKETQNAEETASNGSNVNPSKQSCNIIYSTMVYNEVKVSDQLFGGENPTITSNCKKDPKTLLNFEKDSTGKKDTSTSSCSEKDTNTSSSSEKHTNTSYEVNDEINNKMFKEILKNTDSTIESIRETIIKNSETCNANVEEEGIEKDSKSEAASPKSLISSKGERPVKDNLQLRIVKKDGVFKINKKKKSKRMSRYSSRSNEEPQKLHFGVDDCNSCRTCQVPFVPTTNFSVNISLMELEFSCPNCEEKYLLSDLPKLLVLLNT